MADLITTTIKYMVYLVIIACLIATPYIMYKRIIGNKRGEIKKTIDVDIK